METREYYIYLHITLTTNKVFYIGKGKKDRYISKQNRNKYWLNTVNKYGYYPLIYKDNLTEKEAFELEKELIIFYSTITKLTNLTNGGEGTSGYKYTEEQKKNCVDRFYRVLKENGHPFRNNKTYTIQNNITNEIFMGTIDEIAEKLNLKRATINVLVRGKIKSSNNWHIKGNDNFKKLPKDSTIFTFINHKTSDKFTGNRTEFKKYSGEPSGNIYCIVNQNRCINNWTLEGVKPKVRGEAVRGENNSMFGKIGKQSSRSDKNKYNFINIDGTQEYCTRYELSEKYNVLLKGISKIFSKEKRSYMGWNI